MTPFLRAVIARREAEWRDRLDELARESIAARVTACRVCGAELARNNHSGWCVPFGQRERNRRLRERKAAQP